MEALTELAGQADDVLHPAQRVVGVHQQGGVREAAREGAEGLQLVVMRLHEAVRHGARYRYAVALPGQHVGGGIEPAMKAARAAFNPGIRPWMRRRPNSITGRPAAASTTARPWTPPASAGGSG